jgi:hypothetical protein
MRKVIRIDENGMFIEDVILQNSEATPEDCTEVPCLDGFYHPKFNLETNEWIEGKSINVKEYANTKLSALSSSAISAMSSFKFDNLTFEMSGQVETRLDRLERKMLADDTTVEMWLVLDGTYELGDKDFIYVNKDNLPLFAKAYEDKVRSVLSWKKGAEYWLGIATTKEEVDLISTEYPKEGIPND